MKYLRLAFILLVIQSCASSRPIIKRHLDICKRNAAILVCNKQLWADYSTKAKYRTDIERLSETTDKLPYSEGGYQQRLAIEYVPGYIIRFGEERTEFRSSVPNGVIRNDVFLLHDGTLVAQFVDYIVGYNTIETLVSYSCTTAYPDIYSDVNRVRLGELN